MNEQSIQVKTSGTEIESSRVQREIEARIILARKFPRDIGIVREKILAACKIVSFAEKAVYLYPRGKDENGKKVNVKGPSIRMGEEMAKAMTNFTYGMREMDSGEDWTEVQSFAWDIESNVSETRDFKVPHYRKAGGSIRRLIDPRDVYELVANMGARRMRACILALVPYYIQEESVAECDKTVMSTISGKAGSKRAKKMIEAFAELNITESVIEAKYKKKMKNFSAADYSDLVTIFNALKDGIGKPWDYFDIPEERDASEAGKDLKKDILNRKGDPAENVVPYKAAEKNKADDPIDLFANKMGEGGK